MLPTYWDYEGEAPREPLQYRACGLDNVYLRGGYKYVPTPQGKGLVIKDVQDLWKAITIYLVVEKKVLSGKELRFLRKQLDLTQSELGRKLRLTDQQVARWEKGKSNISGAADVLLRLMCLKHLGMSVEDALSTIEGLIETDAPIVERAVFEPKSDGWAKAA